MPLDRRDFLALPLMSIATSTTTAPLPGPAGSATAKESAMYGRIGKMTAKPGQRDALAAILLEGLKDMPGCLSYIVAADPADVDALWITEVWDSERSHGASLSLPSVRAAIGKGRPMIAAFAPPTVTAPIGGHGLVASG